MMFRLAVLASTFTVAAFAAATATVGRPSTPGRIYNSPCIDSTVGTGLSLTYLRSFGNSTVPDDTLLRSEASLPVLGAGDVTFVSDTTLCRRAAEGIRHFVTGADTGALSPVELYRYGSVRYLGNLPRMGEFGVLAVIDTTFVVVGSVMH